MKRWLLRGIVLIVVLYVALFSTVLAAMLQPPERFGAFMKHVPPVVVWAALPALENVAVGAEGNAFRGGTRSGLQPAHGQGS
jgi:hypothetical protein